MMTCFKSKVDRAVRATALTLSTALALSGCGKQAFVVTSASQQTQAPGSFTIAPKVDILLAEDDTGSRAEVYGAISSQLRGFLAGLQNSGWDYHFASIPLTTDQPLQAATASHFDGNWMAQWVAPYPGATQWGPGGITPNYFVMPSNYQFLFPSQVSNYQNGNEEGFDTIQKALYNRVQGTGFLRSDAMLVIIVVGNGQDTSGVDYSCTRPDGIHYACPGSDTSSFSYYQNQFLALKNGNAAAIQFHAAVSYYTRNDGSCLGGNAWAGSRYEQMASALHGASYDICSQPVSSILGQLAGSLQPIQQAFQRRYLPLDNEPNPATITVTKYINGDANQAVTIPQDATNGWTYAGQINDYLIDYPIQMDIYSGYAVELHGSAKLVGSDTANVQFTRAGAQNSYH